MEHSGMPRGGAQELRVFRPLPQLVAAANVGRGALAALRRQAAADPEGYWEEAADELDWYRKWDRVLDRPAGSLPRWFPGARCNIVYNCLDRHIETANKNKLALIWEGEPGDSRKYTYYELYREVGRFAGALRTLGVAKGDRVVVYMPSLPETVIAMLACGRIGAVHALVYAGFPARVLRSRIAAVRPRLVITANGFYRNGRIIKLKPAVDEALAGAGAESVESVVTVRRCMVETEMAEGRDYWYEDLVRRERPESPAEVMDAGDPLFLLPAVGADGGLRLVAHCHGGYMVGLRRTLSHVFDIKPTDIFWCTADPALISGHGAAIYGPLLAGTTTLLYEGHPNYPQADRLWNIVGKYGVTIFSTTPTLIRLLMRFGTQYPRQNDLSTLRLLGCTGEPIDSAAWLWFYRNIGRGACPIMDSWWQTQTGMFMVSPLPVSLLKPGSSGLPLPGVGAEVVDGAGRPVPAGKVGELVFTRPWPAMPTAFLDAAGREDGRPPEALTRFPGGYATGDLARRDEDGYLWILGHADAVLNLAGHRFGAPELEAALRTHPAVAEAAVVGVPDAVKGEAAKAFLVLKPDVAPSDELILALKNHLRREFGSFADLKSIEFRPALPRDAEGRLLRGALRPKPAGAPQAAAGPSRAAG